MTTEAAKRIGGRLPAETPLVQCQQSSEGGGRFPKPAKFISEYLSDYRPHAKQRELFRNRRHRRTIVVAGRRGGKTFGGARSHFLPRVAEDYQQWWNNGGSWRRPEKLTAKTKPALHYWIVAPTYRLTDFPKREIFDVIGHPEDSDLILSWRSKRNHLWLRGGILIEFRSADNADLLVSAGLDGVWLEEAARLKGDTWRENVSSTLADKGGWALMTSTPKGKNWLYDEWNKTNAGRGERVPGWYGVHWTTADNTAVPALQEEAQRAQRELPEPIYRRNYEASFDAFVGKVFGQFLDDDTHLTDRIPWAEVTRKVAGVDWGYNNPGAQIEFAITADGVWYAYREDYESRLTVAPPGGKVDERDCWVRRFKLARDLRDVERWWADPSSPDHIDQVRARDIDMRPADNSVDAGIEALATLLEPVDRHAAGPGRSERGAPHLRIHRSCEHLRRELSTYQYKDDDSEKPEKTDDHTVDAARYAVFSEHQMRAGGLDALNFSIWNEGAAA